MSMKKWKEFLPEVLMALVLGVVSICVLAACFAWWRYLNPAATQEPPQQQAAEAVVTPPEPSQPSPPPIKVEAANWQIKSLAAAKREASSNVMRISRLVQEIQAPPSSPGVGTTEERARVKGLQRSVDEALLSAYGLSEHLQSVRRELRHAPVTYDAAAKAFRARALDYTDEGFVAECVAWAEKFEALSAAVPSQLTATDALLTQVGPTISFVRETKNLLADYDLFLSTYVDRGEGLNGAQGYLTRLQGYVQRFSKFEEAASAFEKWPAGQSVPQPEPKEEEAPEPEPEPQPEVKPAVRTASFSVQRKLLPPPPVVDLKRAALAVERERAERPALPHAQPTRWIRSAPPGPPRPGPVNAAEIERFFQQRNANR